MLTSVKEVSIVRNYQAIHDGKPILFSYSKDVYDLQGTYRIIEYNGSKEAPAELEKKLLEMCEEMDLGDVELL